MTFQPSPIQPPSQSTTAEGNTGLKARDPWFDNIRFFLIFLVVTGHMLEPMGYGTAYLLIYSFHIPLFAFVSGHFSRSDPGPAQYRALIEHIVIPFIIFEVAYSLFDWWLFDRRELLFSLFKPYWLMWFLFSLAIWKAALPYLARIRFILPISIVLGVAAGYAEGIGYFASVSRTIAFLPFFLAGYFFRRDRLLDMLQLKRFSIPMRIVAIIAFVAAFEYLSGLDGHRVKWWFYGASTYEAMHSGGWNAAGYRLAAYGLAVLLSLSAIVLVPWKRIPFISAAGRNTMYVFLLHGFLVRYWQDAKLFKHFDSIQGKLAILGLAAVICLVLASPPVKVIFKPLIQPRLNFLFKK